MWLSIIDRIHLLHFICIIKNGFETRKSSFQVHEWYVWTRVGLGSNRIRYHFSKTRTSYFAEVNKGIDFDELVQLVFVQRVVSFVKVRDDLISTGLDERPGVMHVVFGGFSRVDAKPDDVLVIQNGWCHVYFAVII